jgi:K+-transporting ATPase KdpF subunit
MPSLCKPAPVPSRTLTLIGAIFRPQTEPETHLGRHHLPAAGARGVRALRPLRRVAAQGLTAMLVTLLYGAAAIGLAIYMVAALIRPDKF